MNIAFSYSLTQDDYLAANKLNFLAALKRRKLLYYPVWGLAIYSLLALLEPQLDVVNLGVPVTGVIFAGSAILAFWLGIVFILLGSTTAKMYRQNKFMQFETSITLLPSGIQVATSQSNATITYNLLFRWNESAEVILLYPGEGIFYVLPRRAMTDEQHDLIISSLLQHLQRDVAAKVADA